MKQVGDSRAEFQDQALFELHPEPICVFDVNGRLITVNSTAERMLGLARDQIPCRSLSQWVREKDKEWVWANFLRAAQGKRITDEMTLLINGNESTLLITMLPVRANGQAAAVYVIAHTLVREEKWAAEKRIQRISRYDTLTGLPNRQLLDEFLNDALRKREREESLAVMFIDLDGFRAVNDSMGHLAGNELLKAVAKRLRARMPQKATLFRIGGDEFIVLLPMDAQEGKAAEEAQVMLNSFAEPWMIRDRPFHLTASIGVAVAPEHGEDAEMLVRHADCAMFHAKQRGKNTWTHYSWDLGNVIAQYALMEDALRQAVNNEEFVLHYQPIIRAADGQVAGAEALIRWNRPGFGQVPPGEFIPLAEKTGLIVAIGRQVLRNVCKQVKEWEERGAKPVRTHVNLSSRQFQDPLFLDTVKEIIRQSGVTPEQIGLEITESLIMDDVEHAARTVQELREMGIMISINDFGTGYSSLSYLKKFPTDTLKIDRTFVRDVAHDSDDEAIIDTILALARILDMKVVAEGVETVDQFRTLSEKGCDCVQGYLFSKPIGAEEFYARYLTG